MNLASRQVRDLRIEQRRQCAQDAALGLSTQSQQDEVMPRENGVHDLRDNRIIEAYDAREHRAVASEAHQQIVSQLVLHAAGPNAFFRKLRMATKLGERAGKITQGRGTSRVTTTYPRRRFD